MPQFVSHENIRKIAETESLAIKMDPLTETLEQVSIRPAKKDISVQFLALCWLPFWQGSDTKLTKAW